ncbi:MAG TPA: hypothetical protein VE422_34310, partial [Terriglobia bacterium]|nr:hypothetical protein [Terriglobia bacterium]
TLLLEPPNVGPRVWLMLFVVRTAHVPGCIEAAVFASTFVDCGAAGPAGALAASIPIERIAE